MLRRLLVVAILLALGLPATTHAQADPDVPGGTIIGPQATSAFCDTVAAVTRVLNLPPAGATWPTA